MSGKHAFWVLIFICVVSTPFSCRKEKQDARAELLRIAEELGKAGRWKHALALYNHVDARQISPDSGLDLNVQKARMAFFLEDMHLAGTYIRKALAIDSFSAAANYELGNLYYVNSIYANKRQLDSAKYFVFRAVRASRSVSDFACANQCFYRLGSIHQIEGNTDSASYYFRKALQYAVVISDSAGMARSYTHVALDLKNSSNYDSSIALDRKAIQFARAAHDRFALGFYLGNLGETLLEMNDLEQARELIDESIIYCRGFAKQTAFRTHLPHRRRHVDASGPHRPVPSILSQDKTGGP